MQLQFSSNESVIRLGKLRNIVLGVGSDTNTKEGAIANMNKHASYCIGQKNYALAKCYLSFIKFLNDVEPTEYQRIHKSTHNL